ncbi:hypothetical protein R1flu_013027 [Riccia fluitans]|uniref:Helicase ATP-binding domain-containing protein n=1 Tax=Riccia fluitans TaxID=41844 RepID=A0ABD1ZDC5_9MARC
MRTVPQKGQKKVTVKGGCPMMSKQKLQKRYVSEALEAGALDIEDLATLGTKLGTCPYYGSRRMVPTSDLVVLPYQSLLHAGTREALGINLKDCVVVIDEAHNLVDTVSDIHSCKVTAHQMKQVHSQLTEYLDKFRKRLTASNRRYVEMLLVLIGSFLRLLSVTLEDEKVSFKARMMTINDFLFSLNIDNLNLFKIRRYIKESNIVHKVSSYGEKLADQVLITGTTSNRSSMTGFHMLAEFIMALTNADTDGRVIVMPKGLKSQALDSTEDGSLKFVMLNAAKHFSEVLDQARAVVLAGGTLQPIEELKLRLFPNLGQDRVHVFSCGHIVPPESILPLAVARGPGNRSFNFTYESRSSPSMIEELGRLMNNVCTVVPEGIVLFFPSFEYETLVFNSWQSAGTLSAIEVKKTVFREPRDAAAVEEVLREYRDCIEESSKQGKKKTGALLLCVVGGKMSEGINFSDGMGRCVVMVGLPYPSPTDPELVERMKYVDLLAAADPHGPRAGGRQQSREYYENLCMKAVNQSIGRAIRHIKDYAAILLVDARYASETSGPSSKLPGWIVQRLVKVTGSFGEAHRHLHQFFRYDDYCVMVTWRADVFVNYDLSHVTGNFIYEFMKLEDLLIHSWCFWPRKELPDVASYLALMEQSCMNSSSVHPYPFSGEMEIGTGKWTKTAMEDISRLYKEDCMQFHSGTDGKDGVNVLSRIAQVQTRFQCKLQLLVICSDEYTLISSSA